MQVDFCRFPGERKVLTACAETAYPEPSCLRLQVISGLSFLPKKALLAEVPSSCHQSKSTETRAVVSGQHRCKKAEEIWPMGLTHL